MSGPLTGFKVVEFSGMGAAPFAAMLLADMGADVVQVDRPLATDAAQTDRGIDPAHNDEHPDLLRRNRRSIAIDLKKPDGIAVARELIASADALIEGFRPGVMERLGLGPDQCLEHNPRLVYGRMTGWGQNGPLASTAGHDINYIALAGALDHIGRAAQPPTPPLNILGNFGGGGMLLAFGIVCALLERTCSGRGQVIDAAMVDGTAVLMTAIWSLSQMGLHDLSARGRNMIDTGAPFYEVYECADGKYVSVGSVEPPLYAELLRRTGLEGDPRFAHQQDRSRWPELKQRLAEVFRAKTQAEWCVLMEDADVGFAPVLALSEAARHPHNVERKTFVEAHGRVQPAPAPRFSRTDAGLRRPPPHAGQDTTQILADWGVERTWAQGLLNSGAVHQR